MISSLFTKFDPLEKYNKILSDAGKPDGCLYSPLEMANLASEILIIPLKPGVQDQDVGFAAIPTMLSLLSIDLVLSKTIALNPWLDRIKNITYTVRKQNLSTNNGETLRARIAVDPSLVQSDNTNYYICIAKFNDLVVRYATKGSPHISYDISVPDGAGIALIVTYRSHTLYKKVNDKILQSYRAQLLEETTEDELKNKEESYMKTIGSQSYICPIDFQLAAEHQKIFSDNTYSFRLISGASSLIFFDEQDQSDFISGSSVVIKNKTEMKIFEVKKNTTSTGRTYYSVQFSNPNQDLSRSNVIKWNSEAGIIIPSSRKLTVVLLVTTSQLINVQNGEMCFM